MTNPTPEQQAAIDALKEREEKRNELTSNPDMETLVEKGTPILGTTLVEGEGGVQLFASKDMAAAWKRFGELKQQAIDERTDRKAAFAREKEIMGDVVLPVGQEVFYEAKQVHGCIISVSRTDVVPCEVFDHPYYKVHLQRDGVYHYLAGENGGERQPAENDCAHLYARHFKNYGLNNG